MTRFEMMWERFRQPQTLSLGCILLVVLLLLSLTALALLATRAVRTQTRYPGALHVDDRDKYTLGYVRWADAYRTTDPTEEVYTWYISKFDLSMITDNGFNEGCFLLNGTRRRFLVERSLNVTVCETPAGQTIFVSQSTWLR